jgi:STE24 endopeptidase
VERATRAYLDSIPAEQRAKSDAYFEGGYWLQLIGLLYGLGVAAILLFGRVSAWMRDRFERITRQPWLQTMLYASAWIALTTLMTLPLSLYQGWFREHQYGLSNLSLPAWLGEQAKSLLISMIFGSIVLAIIYALVRRRGGNWWLPASVVSVLFLLFVSFIYPVFLAPVFNDYKPLGPGRYATRRLRSSAPTVYRRPRSSGSTLPSRPPVSAPTSVGSSTRCASA